MILIIGGAYQGKLTYAKNTFGVTEGDVYTCTGSDIDFSKGCIDHLEAFSLACIREGVDPMEYFVEHKSQWENSILICRDIFCGVVPVEAELRAWRNRTGKLCQYLACEAAQVSRIFCGLEQRLK